MHAEYVQCGPVSGHWDSQICEEENNTCEENRIIVTIVLPLI